MFKNYFKTAFRTLVKNKSYSIINIIGLAVSSASVILLMLWVWDELSYDNMHSEGDRTYITTVTLGPEQADIWEVSPATLAVFGREEIPAIEAATRVTHEFDRIVEYENNRFQEKVVYVDSEFFSMFDFPWVAGNVKLDMTKKIAPLIMVMDPERGWSEVYIRTTAKDARLAIAATEALWDRYNPAYAYKYTFMKENFDEMYREDIRTGTIFNIFAGIAILISCLGLFGLVTYTAETKVKEIGIRKTLGASVSSIILLISKDFMLLIGLSFFISFPLAWWIMNKWLAGYAYKANVSLWLFLLAAFIALVIAAVTVWFKASQAAKANPIKAIATE